jgi:excisionase family DNA binding protein
MNAPVVLLLDEVSTRQLQAALARQATELRRNGYRLTPALAALLDGLAAGTGQSRPALGGMPSPVDDEPVTLLHPRSAARRLSVSPRTVRRWVAAGRLAAVGSGRGRRIVAASVESFGG